MKTTDSMYVLGHLIHPIEANESFSLAFGETPPHADGPPPHFHNRCEELFTVVEGEMSFFLNGSWQTLEPGMTIKLKKGQLHTFRNASDKPLKFINVHYPGGFEAVFAKMGIPASEENAFERSVSEESISNVMRIVQDPVNDFIVPEPEKAG